MIDDNRKGVDREINGLDIVHALISILFFDHSIPIFTISYCNGIF